MKFLVSAATSALLLAAGGSPLGAGIGVPTRSASTPKSGSSGGSFVDGGNFALNATRSTITNLNTTTEVVALGGVIEFPSEEGQLNGVHAPSDGDAGLLLSGSGPEVYVDLFGDLWIPQNDTLQWGTPGGGPQAWLTSDSSGDLTAFTTDGAITLSSAGGANNINLYAADTIGQCAAALGVTALPAGVQ